ncbi:hypothetical protein MPER_08914, partial [Moniliophthora perniciosa FA553]
MEHFRSQDLAFSPSFPQPEAAVSSYINPGLRWRRRKRRPSSSSFTKAISRRCVFVVRRDIAIEVGGDADGARNIKVVGLTWGLHDYLVTLEDEIKYIWPLKRSFNKFMFFWIRYYTITLLVFDVVQIHTFSIPGVTSDNV